MLVGMRGHVSVAPQEPWILLVTRELRQCTLCRQLGPLSLRQMHFLPGVITTEVDRKRFLWF